MEQGEKSLSLDTNANVQEVIGLLLAPTSKTVGGIQFTTANATSNGKLLSTTVSCSDDAPEVASVTTATSVPSVVTTDDMLSIAVDSLETIGMGDGSTLFLQTIPTTTATSVATTENGDSQALPKLLDGQTLQLSDGTTAFVHTTPRGSLHAVQLPDGRIAYIHATDCLLDGTAVDILPSADSPSDAPSGDNVPKQDSLSTSSETKTTTTTDPKIIRVSTLNGPGGRGGEGSARALALGDKAFKCLFPGCERLYTTHHHLKVHERSHTGDRPFHCEPCGKSFATGYGLKSHTRVHTGETPYRCTEASCNKAFKTSGDLQKHIRTHTGERPFKCTFPGCDRAFTTSNIRKVHIRTHTGEKPYTCKYEGCGRAFASATNYKNHIRIHTGEKPYQCPVAGCEKRFTEYSSLYKHHVVHTHAKPYTCGVCGKHYRQTSTLALHKRSAHGIIGLEEEEEEGITNSKGNNMAGLNVDVLDGYKCEEEMDELPSKDIGLDFNVDVVKDEVMTAAAAVQNSKITLNPGTGGTLVTFQTDGKSFDESLVGSSQQQILVVTDPAQLAALQQFAQTLDSSEVVITSSDLDFGTT